MTNSVTKNKLLPIFMIKKKNDLFLLDFYSQKKSFKVG